LKHALALAIVCAVVGSASDAHAHARSVSYATWTVQGNQATVELRFSRLDQNALESRLPALRKVALLGPHLQARVVLFDERGRCPAVMGTFTQLTASTGWVRFEWRVRCSGAPIEVRSDLLFDMVPGHLHFTRALGDLSTPELVLEAGNRSAPIGGAADTSAWRTARRYVGLGITHLLSGWDHVAFVLTLLLVAASLRELISAVSGFTIGHSLSLVLAATGAIHPDAVAVEALIGLSILLVAIESVWVTTSSPRRRAIPAITVAGLLVCAAVSAMWGGVPAIALVGMALFAACYFTLLARAERKVGLRWAVATLFGLIHGFGFASVLSELSGDGVSMLPLLSFNAGVEIGQLLIVAVAWPLLFLARRRGYHLTAVCYGAAVAASLGAFWFASRAWFA
jgi:hypothetical protein